MTVVTNPARTNPNDHGGNSRVAGGENRSGQGGGDTHRTTDTVRSQTGVIDDEKRSDVVFLVGRGGDTWRYPGHRRMLRSTSPAFEELLATDEEVIVIDYVDRRGFEQLLRFHYGEPTDLTSVSTARSALEAAHKFLCPALAERCARRLDELLDVGVALEVLRDLRYLCARLPGAASAPPLSALHCDPAAQLLGQCASWCDSLAHNTLLVLDAGAEDALLDPRFEQLPYVDVALLVRRQTLRVSSELLLAEALYRWASAECDRAGRELTAANRRAALGELAYCPRYLLLPPADLDRALDLELLSPVERTLVRSRASRQPSATPVGPEQENMLRRWARPRPSEPAALPVYLSERSAPPPEEDPKPSGLCARRRDKRPRQPDFTPKKEEGCCACFGDGLLRAFICLFD